jgi:hypothetical protein
MSNSNTTGWMEAMSPVGRTSQLSWGDVGAPANGTRPINPVYELQLLCSTGFVMQDKKLGIAPTSSRGTVVRYKRSSIGDVRSTFAGAWRRVATTIQAMPKDRSIFNGPTSGKHRPRTHNRNASPGVRGDRIEALIDHQSIMHPFSQRV